MSNGIFSDEEVERFKKAMSRTPQTVMLAALCYCRHHKLTIAQTVALLTLMSLKSVDVQSDENTFYFDPQFMSEAYLFYKGMREQEFPDNSEQQLARALKVEYRMFVDVITRQFDKDIEEEEKRAESAAENS